MTNDETRSTKQYQISNIKMFPNKTFGSFKFRSFEFVSDLEFRI